MLGGLTQSETKVFSACVVAGWQPGTVSGLSHNTIRAFPHSQLLCFYLTKLGSSYYQFYEAISPLCPRMCQPKCIWCSSSQRGFWKVVLNHVCRFPLQLKYNTILWQVNTFQLKRNYHVIKKITCNEKYSTIYGRVHVFSQQKTTEVH